MRTVAVLTLAALLAGCSQVPAPSPSAKPSAPRSPATTPSPLPGRPGSLTFRLTLTADSDSTETFLLYLQTSPPSLGQSLFPLCQGFGAFIPGDATPKCLSLGPFERKFAGFLPTDVLVYRIECSCPAGVIAKGTHVADGSVIEVTYPPQ